LTQKKKVKKERNEEKLLDTPCSNLLSSAKMEGEEREKKIKNIAKASHGSEMFDDTTPAPLANAYHPLTDVWGRTENTHPPSGEKEKEISLLLSK